MKGTPDKPELLSPAGDFESLKAAVRNGADAVYLGVREFNARVYARNFSLPELGQAVTFCHGEGVRVYLALNTLVKNHELSRFFELLSRAYTLELDGVIIQQVSLLDIIKRSFPGLKVFLSTQAAIGNAAGAAIFRAADRIILPRELTLPKIKTIVDSGVSVEVFVHGALCYSYSGLCLFSSFVSSRSGNRGSCAQLCRQRYNGAYPLSTRELCLVRKIPQLIEAGISGFKIEGRMRSPLYVAVATRLYRKAIDSYLTGRFIVPEREMEEIEVVFNREFTGGFTGGATSLTSPEKPMNRGAFLGEFSGGEVLLHRSVAVGDGIGIWQGDDVSGAVIKKLYAEGREVSSASAGQKVTLNIKAVEGARLYLTSSPRITIDPDFVVKRAPIVLPPRPDNCRATLPHLRSSPPLLAKILVKVYSIEEALAAAQAGADIVFYNIFSPDFPHQRDWSGTAVFGAYLPRIMDDNELSAVLELITDLPAGNRVP